MIKKYLFLPIFFVLLFAGLSLFANEDIFQEDVEISEDLVTSDELSDEDAQPTSEEIVKEEELVVEDKVALSDEDDEGVQPISEEIVKEEELSTEDKGALRDTDEVFSDQIQRVLAADSEKVLKENLPIIEKGNGKYELIPYAKRRSPWTTHVDFTYSSFEPESYRFTPAGENDPRLYTDIYDKAQIPLLEFGFTVKRNFSFLSLGVQGRIGLFNVQQDEVEASTSNPGGGENVLLIYSPNELKNLVYSIGAVMHFNMLFDEPVVVPFFGVGAYVTTYDVIKRTVDASTATVAKTEETENTSPAVYYSAGFMFQLNGLNKEQFQKNYLDTKIENYFLILEYRKFEHSSKDEDPEFGGDHFNIGLSVEF